MTFLILRHIDPRHHVLVVEQEACQRLRQFCLADAGSTHEQERADRALLVGKSCAVAAHCIGHCANSFILADDTLVQLAFHAQQLVFFAFQHTFDGDAGPLGHHLGNVFRRNGLGDKRFFDGLGLGGELVDALLGVAHLAVANLRHLAVVAAPFGRCRLLPQVFHLLTGPLQAPQDILLLTPALHQHIALALELLQLGLQLFKLDGYAFALNRFTLNFFLPYCAVQLVYRLRHRIHLQPQL